MGAPDFSCGQTRRPPTPCLIRRTDKVNQALSGAGGALASLRRSGHQTGMDFGITLGGAVGVTALGVLFGWLGARPPDLRKGPRLVPYRFLMALCAVAVMMLLVHLVNLSGFTTGRTSAPIR